jgi:hypothetical protein
MIAIVYSPPILTRHEQSSGVTRNPAKYMKPLLKISNGLHNAKATTTSTAMNWRGFHRITDSKAWRLAMLSLGWLLICGSPLLGPIPGPGPLIILPIGLALVLKHSLWAKKRYARAARRYPDYANWANWAMRRNRVAERPAFPDIKRDFMHLFRRDDVDARLP